MKFDTDARIPGPGSSPPLTLTSTDPRIFGVVPALLALGLGLGGILIGIVLLFVGRPPIGIAAIGPGVLLLAFALDSARRWPTSPVARGLVRTADGIGSHLGLARVFAGTWSEAVRDVIRLRTELRALEEERDRQQFELGGAAARGDEEAMADRRSRLEELERRMEEVERAIAVTVQHARERVGRERASIRPTQAFAVEEAGPSSRKTTATVPRRADDA